MEVSDFANIISIVSGLMTLLGVGGFFSWSIYDKSKEPDLSGKAISIFAYSVKFGLCILVLLLMLLPVHLCHISIVLAIGNGSIGSSTMYWSEGNWYAYVVSYIIIVSIWLPIYLLLTASVFHWSFSPFKLFFAKMQGKSLSSAS
ncbi:hypothetical protein [Vibrio splendidus]|uniref:hypothetical protein n=1 Tax=Vibrio splendidus TaxID=29497 RepID=UPI00080E79C9|nr:hypothetical protein [Vibrio splendidus]OCH70095.1 hypothetical protein A6D94_21810 [Vibrio splendidus]